MTTKRKTVTGPRAPSPAAIAAPAKLSVEVTLPAAEQGVSLFSDDDIITRSNIDQYRPNPGLQKRTAQRLIDLGFNVVAPTPHGISVQCTPVLFTKTFGTKLRLRSIDRVQCGRPLREKAFHAPEEGASWEIPGDLKGLVERAYIQPPVIYLESPMPPKVNYFHLNIADISMFTRARQVHQQGITGKGVKVVMIDSGFYNHPFYQANGFNAAVVLAPGALNPEHDEAGHGTAQAANIFATAPGVTLTMLKQGPSAADALRQAIEEIEPDIIVCSWCFDLAEPAGIRRHLASVPNTFKMLHLAIVEAAKRGICVICAAGNGQVAFPGMHPDVISVGGAFVGPDLKLRASDLASAFDSKPFPGRHVPDLCGLVGLKPAGVYIMLPLQPGSSMDRGLAAGPFPGGDMTSPNDGWAVTSGTSAAAPQIAGVCALLKQKNPSLTPNEIKQALIAGAADVAAGSANPDSNQGVALQAGAGRDGATGHGFVDAAASVARV